MKMTVTDEALLRRRLAGELPMIEIIGHPFIIDWRLKELRPVNDLGTRLDLKRMAMDEDGLNYLCFYHIPTRSEVHIDGSVTELPKDTVLLTIPYELKLDPVGVAREYGLKDTYLLHSYPIQSELKAKVTPLEETALPDMIRENRAKQKNIKTNRKQGRRKRGL